jgi:hypothetical protein
MHALTTKKKQAKNPSKHTYRSTYKSTISAREPEVSDLSSLQILNLQVIDNSNAARLFIVDFVCPDASEVCPAVVVSV